MDDQFRPHTDDPRVKSVPFRFSLAALLTLVAIFAVTLALWRAVGPGWAVAITLPPVLIFLVTSGSRRRRFAQATVAGLAMLLLGALLIPVARSGRGPSRRITCLNNLQQLTKALLVYKARNGQFPPPYVADETGKPMHSWRVLILPYLEQQGLYDAYKFDEPWDGPNNSKLHNLVLDLYRCPSGRFGQTETNYVALVGPGTAWDTTSGSPMPSQGATASQTIVLVEMAVSGIHWMEPRDLDIRHMATAINSPNGPAISSKHGAMANVAFTDGRAQVITNEMLSPLLLRILGRNAEENERTNDQ
jgi:hypothetical protein